MYLCHMQGLADLCDNIEGYLKGVPNSVELLYWSILSSQCLKKKKKDEFGVCELGKLYLALMSAFVSTE